MARKTAHAELDDLRAAAGREATARREAEVAAATARAALNRLEGELGDAYYNEQAREAAQLRRTRPDLEADVEDAELRLAAATRRSEEARAGVDAFETERAHDLLAETARRSSSTARSNVSVSSRANRSLAAQTERQATDELVNRVGRARYDCPDSSHPFTSALNTIRAKLAEGATVPAYVPHWEGHKEQAREDRVKRLVRLRRIKGRGGEQEAEIERVQSELAETIDKES